MPPFRNYKASGRGNGGRFGGRFGNKNSTKPKQEFENTNAQYLVIVESPSKCPKIAQYLGEQYQVIASIGHIRELTSLKNAFDPSSSSHSVVPPHNIPQTSETNPESEIPPTSSDQIAPKKRGRPPKTATSNILIPTPEKKVMKKVDLKQTKETVQTPIFTICKDKLAHVEKMRSIMARFHKSNILLATDDDREGEAIAWHICQVFDLPLETTRRIVFHSITYEEIVKAVQNPRPVDMNLVHAQQSRQILDVIVGFKISPFLWKHVGNQANAKQGESLSAGRCQTPALRLVYDAHLKSTEKTENTTSDPLNHKETGKYKVKANFFTDNLEFAAKIHDDFPLQNPQQMQTFLEQSLTWQHKLQLIPTSKHSQSQPPKPFTTSHLLQTASSRLGMSPKATMMLCQKLYQNGHITYMRTDCANYSPEFIVTAHAFIGKSYGNKYVSGLQISDTTSQNHSHAHPAKETAGKEKEIKNKSGKEKAVQAQEAHEAIRVTHLETMGQLGIVKKRGRPKANAENGGDESDQESGDESDGPEKGTDKSRMNTLYQLIWQNTVESCMSPYTSEKTPITISGPQLAQYQYEIEIPKFLGWKIVKTTEKENRTFTEKQQAILNYLNQVNPESNLMPTKITAEYTEPRPPFYYNEASLIEKLESAGIGRPSTFAMLVETIQDRGYVLKRDLEGRAVSCIDFVCEPQAQSHKDKIKRIQTQKKMGAQKAKLVIQPVGIQVLKFLLEHFPSLFEYEYTSLLEKKLDEIAKGLLENGQIERECYEEITRLCRPLSRLEKREYDLKDNPEYKVGYGISGPMVYRYVSDNAVRVSVQPNDVLEMVEGGHEDDLEKDLAENVEENIAETNTKKKTTKPKPKPKPEKPEKLKKEYLPLKKNIQWDQEKLEKGLYQLSELVEFTDPHLGILDDLPVYLKTGKFGPYVQWGDKNIPIQSVIKTGIQISDLTLEHVLDLLKPTTETELKPSTDKKVLRVFTKEVSVRMGKFGAYVFVAVPKSVPVAKKGYKKSQSQQEKPTFVSLASLGENYMNCSHEKFMTWLEKMLLK